MRFVRALHGDEVFYAVLKEDKLLRLHGTPFETIDYDGREYSISSVTLLYPSEPTKFVCVGKNYYEHAEEMKEGHPVEPLLFLKPSTCAVGNGDDVIYPTISNRLDYEGELAVVIGKRAHAVEIGHAKEYIFGYTCANDVTARDIQKSDPQWTRGKGFDTLCPFGPWIETELDAQNVNIATRVNGVTKQNSNTSMMTYDIDALISYMSACMTLLPGDVVLTGTPGGIGSMQRGDTVEVEIAGIGVLRNRIV
ncbi:MAG TPA: fumarylacetoacetate hydrolase family protein [Clostridia bacterium]|nr:fumarylacetoacetate hydrolase family protein [Clostridia bacterium]